MRTRIISSAMCIIAVLQFSCGKTSIQTLRQLTVPTSTATGHQPEIINGSSETATEKKPITQSERFNQPVDDFEKPVQRTGIVSPSPENDVPFQHYSIDAATGATITYDQTGSTVSIPPDALVDKDGNPVTGKVDISYREFHTQKDVFFSGIPMDFEVNGEQQFFETAGMIDITASQNNQEVFVKKDKVISFKMSTDNPNKEVKLYELDKKSKKWKEAGEAPVTFTAYKPKKIWGPVYKSKNEKVKKKRPVYIKVGDYFVNPHIEDKILKRKLNFEFSIGRDIKLKNNSNKQSFKAARIINHTTFEISGYRRRQFNKVMQKFNDGETYINSKYLRVVGDIEIIEANYPYITLRFTYDGNVQELETKVTFNGMSKKRSLKYFDQIKNFDFNNFDGRHSLVNEQVNVIDHFDSIEVYGDESYINKMIVQREFTSRNFGILNCDQPKALPDERIAHANFMVNDEKIKPQYAVLVDFGRKCQYTYYDYAFSKFGYDPGTRNFIFTVDQEGNVAYIMPENFERLAQDYSLDIPLQTIKITELAIIMEDLFPSKTTKDYII